MVDVLIRREARRLLARTEATFPGSKGFTATPTTEVLFRLFDGIDTVRVDGSDQVTVTNMTTPQAGRSLPSSLIPFSRTRTSASLSSSSRIRVASVGALFPESENHDAAATEVTVWTLRTLEYRLESTRPANPCCHRSLRAVAVADHVRQRVAYW